MKRITEKDFETTKTIYMVVMNLTGLHEKVYSLHHWKDPLLFSIWVDKSRDVCLEPDDKKVWGWNLSPGRVEFITKDKDIAEGVLNTLKIYKSFVSSRL